MTLSSQPRSIAPVLLLAALLLLAAALAAPPAVAQQVRPSGEVFTGETTVLAVEVPVQVLRGGEPVRGLTAGDFVVWEGDERRELTGFDVVDLALTGGEEPAGPGSLAGPMEVREAGRSLPAAGHRHFLLLFDLAFTETGNLTRAVDGARDLLRDGLHPDDRVGVAFYSDTRGAELVLQPTTDRAQVSTVLDAFESLLDGEVRGPGDASAVEPRDPLALTAGGWMTALAEVGRAAGYQTSDFAEAFALTQGMGSGVGGFLSNNLLAHSAAFMEQVYREQRAAQVGYLMDGMRELARALRGISGSKHLVLFSQGYDASLTDPTSNWAPGNAGIGSGGGAHVLSDLGALVDELRRSGWILHGADVKGLRHPFEGSGSSFREGLFYLANETGGVLIENTNDLSAGLGDVLERTAVTYVLTFQVEEVAVDGAFHPLRVELTGGPKGASLTHRTGYYAPLPAGERDPFEERVAAATRLLSGVEVSDLSARVVATSFAFDGGTARVPVLVEVAEPGLAAGPEPIEAFVYAFAEDGAVADHFARSVDPASGGAAELRGLKLTGELRLPPGRYELRTLVRSPHDGREALRRTPLTVPEPEAGPGLLPPLFVQDDGERWVVATLGRAAEGGEDAYPFLVEGKRIAPAAAPVLAPGEAARVLIPGLGLPAADAEVESRVVDAAGAAVAGGRLEVLGRRPPAAGQPDLLVARFDAAGLPPGEYALEVTLSGGGPAVTAPFRVAER